MVHGITQKQKLDVKLKQEDICYPNLPHEIVTDILSRLPVKLLKRLSCLWKPWRDLIKNPSFAKMHLQQASTHNNHVSFMVRFANDTLLSVDYNGVRFGKRVRIDYPYNNGGSPVEILGSCNGLFLLRVQGLETLHNCLWNPSTREYKDLPNAGIASDSQIFGCIFYNGRHDDPSYGWYLEHLVYSFGYNSIIDDYNVVRVLAEGPRYSPTYTVDVYTLGSNSWRRVGDIPYELSGVHSPPPGILVNGAIHWVGINTKDALLPLPEKLIIALDLRDDKYREVPLPYDFDNRFCFGIAALGGCLCLVSYGNSYDRNGDTDVWMMKDYGVQKSWSKFTIVKASEKANERCGQVFGQTDCGQKGSIASSNVRSEGPSTMFCNMLDDMKLIMTAEEEGIIVKDGKQCSFLLYGKSYERVKSLENEICDVVEPYMCSLVSLNSGTYCEGRQWEDGWSDDTLTRRRRKIKKTTHSIIQNMKMTKRIGPIRIDPIHYHSD